MKWPSEWNWKGINDWLGDFQRPYTTYICSTTLALSVLNEHIAPVSIPTIGLVIGANVAGRSIEKVQTIVKEADVRKTTITAGTPSP